MVERNYSGARVLVVGAARSGIAVTEFLLARGASVVLTDVKTESQLSSAVGSLRSEEHEGRLVLELGAHRAERGSAPPSRGGGAFGAQATFAPGAAGDTRLR